MNDEYLRKAIVMRVIDGDTVDLSIDLGFNIYTNHRVRLSYIDTPERGQPGWNEATAFVTENILHRSVIIKSAKSDKFGRYLGTIYFDLDGSQVCLNDLLLQRGFATRYGG